ncbi:MAG: hypothetical protein Q4F97_02675 [Bacteroidales bacterium]|nr:hypothetical protein [Bacteroidales bacterium]
MASVVKTAEWTINGHQIDIFEIDSNYIVKIYNDGKYSGMRVFKKNFLNRLSSVRKSLEKELSAKVEALG